MVHTTRQVLEKQILHIFRKALVVSIINIHESGMEWLAFQNRRSTA